MCSKWVTGSVVVVTLLAGSVAAYAQRGTGERTGVASKAEQPKGIELVGTLDSIRIGPCENTTGRGKVGAHLILITDTGEELNVHAGPAATVGDLLDSLPIGETVTVQAFQTEGLKAGHYVAQSVEFAGTVVDLRDANLRPNWAGGGGRGRGMASRQAGYPFAGNGAGMGPGRGYGQGRCPRWNYFEANPSNDSEQDNANTWQGRGRGQGFGQGQGRGRGQGFGQGQGGGRGPGFGRGASWADPGQLPQTGR